jgi:hypothetical protein
MLQVQRTLNEMRRESDDIFDFLLKYVSTNAAVSEKINGARSHFERLLHELNDTILTFQVSDLLVLSIYSNLFTIADMKIL